MKDTIYCMVVAFAFVGAVGAMALSMIAALDRIAQHRELENFQREAIARGYATWAHDTGHPPRVTFAWVEQDREAPE